MSSVTKRSELPRTLANALARGRVAHAYLFTGSVGSGKLAAARDFAAALLCNEGLACGNCRSCRLVAQGSHPDYRLLAPEGETYTIKQVRELIASLAERPLIAARRVVILDTADRMRTEAANALLKTLEEPPPYGHLILVTARPETLPVTILSRCQSVRFSPPPLRTAEAALRPDLPAGLARFVARATGGDGERAAALIAEYDLKALRDQAFDLLLGARSHREDWLLLAAERAESYRRDGDKLWLFLDLVADVARDSLAVALGASQDTIGNSDRDQELATLAGAFTIDELAAMIEECERTKDLIKKNVNTRLALEVLFLRLRAGTRTRGRGVRSG